MRKVFDVVKRMMIIMGIVFVFLVAKPEKEVHCAIPESGLARNVFDIINIQRQIFGSQPLVWNDRLATDAAVRTEETSIVLAHMRPDGTPWWTVDPALIIAENLSKDYFDPNVIVYKWLKSPAHAVNMLSPRYNNAAISVLYKDGHCYVALELGF